MKRSKLFRKKLLPLFLSVAVAGSQVPVMAADFGDTAVVSADADETERSQSIRNQGQIGESSEAGAEDGGTTQNDTDGVSVAGTSDTETEEISQGVTTIFRRSWIRMTEQTGLRRIVRRMFFLILQRTHLEMEPVMGKTPK